MGYTAGSCCGDKVGHGALPVQVSGGGNKGEERVFARRGRREGGHVPKRRKKGGGSGTGTLLGMCSSMTLSFRH